MQDIQAPADPLETNPHSSNIADRVIAEISATLAKAHHWVQVGQRDAAIAHCHAFLQQLDIPKTEYAKAEYPEPMAGAIASVFQFLGLCALQQRTYQLALEYLQQAIALDDTVAESHNIAGVTCFRLGRIDEGIAYYEQAVALHPKGLDIRYNLALGLQKIGRASDAIPHFEDLLQQEPCHIAGHYQLANSYQSVRQFEPAIAHYQQALDLLQQPDVTQSPINQLFLVNPEHIWYNLGVALQDVGELSAAEAAYRQAIGLRVDYADALNALGTLLERQDQEEEASALYRQTLNLQPDYIPALSNLGHVALRQQDWQTADFCFQHLRTLDPGNLKAIDGLLKLATQTCRWQDLEALTQTLWEVGRDRISTDIALYHTLFLNLSAHQLKILAQNHATAIQERLGKALPQPLPQSIPQSFSQPAIASSIPPIASSQSPTSYSRLRLGYVSGDYRNQAVAHLISRLFVLHDRQQFEVYAYSLGPNDHSIYRQTFESDADVFRDVKGWSSAKIAQQIAIDNIHILIDLEGYTAYAQVEIYARRPAPIIVSYLGHTGTMGADYIDYVITDDIITPSDYVDHLVETCIYLPSYQLNNNHQPLPKDRPTRSEVGLPEEDFVFCGFNKIQKIHPQFFDRWLNILSQVPNSVLWLLQSNPDADTVLTQTAIEQNIDPARIIFAPSLPKADHIHRLQCADLFLDTPYHNAQVTGSDMLWAGVPMITCPGETFPSRVAASLLTTAGLPELITNSPEAYEHLAIHLALHPEELQTYRQHLVQNRTSCALFNTEATVLHLETAYRQIWTNHQAGVRQPIRVSPNASPASAAPSTPVNDETMTYADVAMEHHRQGLQALQHNQAAIALRHFEQAIALMSPLTSHGESLASPLAQYHNHAGVACFQLAQREEGISHYQTALEFCPEALDIRYNLAIGLQKVGRYQDAASELTAILAQTPAHLPARYQLGNCYQKQRKFEDAIACYRPCIAELATIRQKNQRKNSGHQSVRQNVPISPKNLWYNLGVALKEQRDSIVAEQAFHQALAYEPNHAESLVGLSHSMQQQHRVEDAIAPLIQALYLAPHRLDWRTTLGKLYLKLHQWEKAKATLQAVLTDHADHLSAIAGMVQLASKTCDWETLATFTQRLWDVGKDTISTDIQLYQTLFLDLSPHQLQILAQNHATAVKQRVYPTQSSAGINDLPDASADSSDTTIQNPKSKIQNPSVLRLGYVSGDYRQQAIAYLIYDLFALHNRQHFQVYAYSLGPDDGSDYRRKFETEADVFRDVRTWSAAKIAQQIQADDINILIDLEGYTQYAQTEIYALRPAPVILSYLGHPGTMGADYIDYLITDWAMSPPEQLKHLTEKCIYLPTSAFLPYRQTALPEDRYVLSMDKPTLPLSPSRTDLGLPEDKFVFCAFHKIQKLEPMIWGAWLHILAQVPSSVLWLFQPNTLAEQNLCHSAQEAGIDPDRLIFAPPMSRPDYLASLQKADLFLDSRHMNAGATAVDVLWAGLPLITIAGRTMSSRIATSLLTALDSCQFIASHLDDYECLAIDLATHPDRLTEYRHQLQQQRYELFNPEQTIRHLEAAYQHVWNTDQTGQSSKILDV